LSTSNTLPNKTDRYLASIILRNVSFFLETKYSHHLHANVLSCLDFPERLVEDLTEYSELKPPAERKCQFPKLHLRITDEMAVLRKEDEYTFISFGAPQKEKASIAGLFLLLTCQLGFA